MKMSATKFLKKSDTTGGTVVQVEWTTGDERCGQGVATRPAPAADHPAPVTGGSGIECHGVLSFAAPAVARASHPPSAPAPLRPHCGPTRPSAHTPPTADGP